MSESVDYRERCGVCLEEIKSGEPWWWAGGSRKTHVACFMSKQSGEAAKMPLKSVDDYNNARRKAKEDAAAAMKRTGVACPGCGGEMLWDDSSDVYIIPVPSTREARCRPCGLTVKLER